MDRLTYDDLRGAVAGGAVALRARTALEPAGGKDDKIFPSTYGADRGQSTRYALEERRVGDRTVRSVVLDSVAARAHALGGALLEAAETDGLPLPKITVDFSVDERTRHLDRVSSLEAPHRVFDALLRDSLDGDVLFRLGRAGRSITEASPANAAALLHWSPTTLLFGGWDSTGPRGGRGAKYERAITSEIVAFGIETGVRTSSRIDPAGIELAAAQLYEAEGGGWTLDESEAVKEGKKGEPKLYAAGEGKPGRPSQVNHGNVRPSREADTGGVTADRIEMVTVLSLVALRRLRFPLDATGQPLPAEQRRAAEVAARTAVAALGVAAAVLAYDEGFDLRSRCVLHAKDKLTFHVLVSGEDPREVGVTREQALDLVQTAVERLRATGLTWADEELRLVPAERLAELIGRSRALSEEKAAGADEPAEA